MAILETNNDITDRKRAEEELRRSQVYLTEAQRVSHTGSWAIDVVNRRGIHSSEEHRRLYGFDPSEAIPAWEEWEQRIHPEDRERRWVLWSKESSTGRISRWITGSFIRTERSNTSMP